jgi:hypothetical protein
MNPVRELVVFVKLNWRIIALCALVAVIVAGVMRYDRNRNRFVQVQAQDYLLDTRTGRYCDPWPLGWQDSGLPKCADLAKRWW